VTREDVRALVAEAVVVHVALSLDLPATARRAAVTCERLARSVAAGIPRDAVDRDDAEYPEDVSDPASWARLALGIRDDDEGDDVGGPT